MNDDEARFLQGKETRRVKNQRKLNNKKNNSIIIKRFMKTLNIKRIFVYTIYNKLRNVPPKDYPTTAEIKSTISIVLPALKEHVDGYASLFKEAEDISLKIASGELTEENAKLNIDRINTSVRTYNSEHGSDIVSVTLDDEGFKTLNAQFNRENWGKNWMANIEEFAELSDVFAEASK